MQGSFEANSCSTTKAIPSALRKTETSLLYLKYCYLSISLDSEFTLNPSIPFFTENPIFA